MEWAERICIFPVPASVLAVVGVLLLGCSPQRALISPAGQPGSEPAKTQAPAEYRIQPGDQLEMKFFYNPELNEIVLVRPDGKISLQLIDEIQAAGLTPSELDAVLTRTYAQELRRPVVTVIVRSFVGQRIYVGGEVGNPGLVNLAAGMTPLQAVINAGGFRETGKPDGVIVIRKGPDNRPIPLRVDLKQILDGDSTEEQLQLQPYDIVFVPKSWIAEANKFVNEYIERLLLYRGATLGLGFTYELKGTPR